MRIEVIRKEKIIRPRARGIMLGFPIPYFSTFHSKNREASDIMRIKMAKNGCSALIFSNKKILLFLRDNSSTIPYPNCWSLPGGQMEDGETPDETIQRELIEEVSYVPKKLQLLGYTQNSSNIVYVYYATVTEDEEKKFVHNKGEGQGIQFFPLAQVRVLNLTPGLRYYVENYKNVLENFVHNNTELTAQSLDLQLVGSL